MPMFDAALAAAEAVAQAQTAVIPVVVGPIQILIAIAPGLLAALAGWFLAAFKPQSLKVGALLLWRFKIQVVLIAGVVWGCTWTWQRYAPLVFADSHSATSAAMVAGTDWTAFRGGPQRNGWLGTPEAAEKDLTLHGPNRAGNAWTWKRSEWQVLSSPTVVGKSAYFATATITPYDQDGMGRIVCLDTDTGTPRWIWDGAALENYRATFSSPAVAGRFLVIGEGLHFLKRARLYCFDISSGQPVKLWSYLTNDHVESSPAIQLDADGKNGTVVVGAGVDGYYCFDLVPKNPKQIVPRWKTFGGRGEYKPGAVVSMDAESSPLIHNGRVYVGNGNGMYVNGVFMPGEAIQCLDLATGKEIWKLSTDLPTFGPCTLLGDHLYVGMGNGDFINDANIVRENKLKIDRANGLSGAALAKREAQLAPAGAVWKIRLTNQGRSDEKAEKVGEFKTTMAVLSAVAHTQGRLVFSDTSGMLYSVDTELRERARWNAGAKLMASPAVADDMVYCLPVSGVLYALDVDRLRPLWENFIGSGGLFVGSPAVANNRVIVPSGDHGVQAIGSYSAVPPPESWPAERGAPSGSADGMEPSPSGNFLWNWPLDQNADSAQPVLVSAAVAVAHDAVLIPVASGTHAGLVAIAHDRNAAATPPTKWQFRHPLGVAQSPVVVDQTAMVLTGRTGEPGRELIALHARGATAGTVLWRMPISGSASLSADVRDVAVATSPRVLSLVSATGAVHWRAECVHDILGSCIAGPVVVVATTREVLCLSRATSVVLWRSAIDARSAPVLHGSTVLVASKTGVAALHLGDGTALSSWEQHGPCSAFACDGRGENGVIASVIDDGTLIITRSSDGGLLARFAKAARNVAPIIARGMVLWMGSDGQWLSCKVVSDGRHVPWSQIKSSAWFDGGWLGAVTTAPVGSASGVYVGYGPWGLVRLAGGK